MKKVILSIKDGGYLSLDDIHQLKANNCSVLRSAHVGNLDSQTLFLAKEGFSIVLDEYARGSMRVYRPAYKIKNRNEIALSTKDDLPVTHLYLTKELSKENNCVASFHYKNLEALFPNSIKLTSTHLLKQKAFIYQAFKILAQERPHSFAKLIEEDGKVFKFNKSENQEIYFCDDFGDERIIEVSQIPDLVISGLEYTEKLLQGEKVNYSPIITLDVDTDVSLITLCDINWNNINSETKDIKAIHFSGLEMINYMVKNKDLADQHRHAMNEIFNLLIHIWTKVFPEKIEILIVPTDSLHCFICETEREQKILKESFLADITINRLVEQKRTLWKNHQKETSEYVMSLLDKDIISLIKSIDSINAPESFIKTVSDIKKKLDKGICVERKILNQIVFNYLLYKNMEVVGITEIERNIIKEKKNTEKAKIVTPAVLTQYDLLSGKKIYFPDMARSLSSNELRNFNRRIKKSENKIK